MRALKPISYKSYTWEMRRQTSVSAPGWRGHTRETYPIRARQSCCSVVGTKDSWAGLILETEVNKFGEWCGEDMTHLSHCSFAVKSRHYPFSGMKWKWNERKRYQDYAWRWSAGRWKSDVKKEQKGEGEEWGDVAVTRTKGWKKERESARGNCHFSWGI